MSATIDFPCPNCNKPLKLPVELAGKLIRCKNCQGMLEVPESGGAKPAPAKSLPAKAAPAKAIPAKAAPAKAVPTQTAAPAVTIPIKTDDAPIAMKPLESPPPPPPPSRHSEDDEDNSNPYTLTDDGAEIPRCPFCAKELDPPDTKVCLNCGFHMMERKRHETKRTIAPGAAEYIKHLGPGVACVLAALAMLTFAIFCFLNMEDWMTGGILDSDKKNSITGKSDFLIKPYCFNLWIGLFCFVGIYLCVKFAIKRLILDWKPEEKLMK